MTQGRGSIVVLLVEDDPVISLDTSLTLQNLGADRVEAAFTLEEAAAVLDRETPTLAVLDIDLRGATTFALAQRLVTAGVRCVFTTGHGAEMPIPAELQDMPIISKPYDPVQLRAILQQYIQGRAEL